MRDIGWLTAGTVVFVVITICLCLSGIFAKSQAEQCAASCGPGRFKSWTGSAIGALNQPNTPEKCECLEASR